MTTMSDIELAEFIHANPPALTDAEYKHLRRRLAASNKREERADFLIEAALLFHDYLKARAEAKGFPLNFDCEDWRASEDRLVSSLLDGPYDEVLGVTIEVKRKYIYLTDPDQPREGFLRRWMTAYPGRE